MHVLHDLHMHMHSCIPRASTVDPSMQQNTHHAHATRWMHSQRVVGARHSQVRIQSRLPLDEFSLVRAAEGSLLAVTRVDDELEPVGALLDAVDLLEVCGV